MISAATNSRSIHIYIYIYIYYVDLLFVANLIKKFSGSCCQVDLVGKENRTAVAIKFLDHICDQTAEPNASKTACGSLWSSES